MRKGIVPLALAAALLASGCAGVKVMKVQVGPNEKEPEGFPFYLPRPYVQVYEPFVIGSKAWLVEGQITPDGQFLHIDNASTNLDGALATTITRNPRFPVSGVRFTTPQGLAGGAQSGDENPADASGGGKKDEPKKGDGKKEDAKAEDGAKDTKPAEPASPVGQFNVSVTQSPVPFTPTLGRRFFDVVWMPDFDEKYVVQGTPGLGNANIGVTMVQGWGLYGLDARIDNSAIVKPLLNFYSTGLDALSQLAKSKILPASALQGGAQSGDVDAAVKPRQQLLTAGTRVSVKVTKVLVAAPGLYPVLKPAEVARATDTRNAGIFLPNRPYTNVAFNTYEVLVVEAAKATGDSPMNLQRYFDTDAQGNAVPTPAPPDQASTQGFDAAEFTTHVNNILKDEKSPDGAFWVISGVKADANRLAVTATLTGGGKQKPAKYATTNALKQLLFVQSKFPVGSIDLTEK